VNLVLVLAALSQDAATLSFAEHPAASFPRTIEGREKVVVDLSGLKGAAVHRAVFRPGRDEGEAFASRDAAIRVTAEGSDEPLALLPPRFTSLDATAAVRRVLEEGGSKVVFRMAVFPGYRPMATRLDVTCAAKARNRIPAVTGLVARHRAGQTFLTWNEIDPPIAGGEVTFREWRARLGALDGQARQVRYRIYRSAEPISAATIARADLVDEVGPHTGWNTEYYGISPKDGDRLRRYAVEDGKEPVPPGTGVYAHNPRAAGKAFYAVSASVNGEEDFAGLGEGSATKEGVEETVGPGEPVLQRIERPKSFSYVDGPTLHYYVRWEAPPRSNRPSRPFDVLVAVPPGAAEPAPVGLHLHCWGGSLDGGYGWWYNAAQGAFLLSTNQIPYDWWTGYHEHDGTWKAWKEGVVRDFTQARVIALLDWAAARWKLDLARVFTAGNSMGGSGSPSLGIRRSDRVAWTVSWVGVHTPARSPQFRGSYERVYGALDWKLSYQDGRTPAFEFFDDAAFLRGRPAHETPLICFSNGKNDGAIGWPQARDFWKALQETRRPHVFVWGQGGHGQRAILPGPSPGERELGIDVRLDRTLPAFSNGSLDGNPGNGDPKDGDPEGQSNLWLLWEAGEEAEGTWAMRLKLNGKAPRSECTVDVTPRRCQKFRPAAGARVSWRVTGADLRELESGEVVADGAGLVTASRVPVRREGVKLQFEVKR
jgi:hypothetical protein